MRVEYLLDKEVDQVLSALTYPNRLVMRTALATGLRVGDVLALTPDRLKPHFWVTEQKTGKKRQVGLPEPLLSDLKKHSGKTWVFPPESMRTANLVMPLGTSTSLKTRMALGTPDSSTL